MPRTPREGETVRENSDYCGNKNYGEIWQWFYGKYGRHGYSEYELRQIHNRWRKIAAQC